jgi:hypothetical protein
MIQISYLNLRVNNYANQVILGTFSKIVKSNSFTRV